jgi:hypothetical protein
LPRFTNIETLNYSVRHRAEFVSRAQLCGNFSGDPSAPGNYRIVATFAGNAVTRQVAVGATNLSTVDFRWVSE